MSVPVLSKIKVRQRSICSRAAGFLITIPRLAEIEMAPIMATGIAINKGHGVAMTTTARKRCALPLHSQAPAATATAAGVYQAPSISPRRRMGGRFLSVCSITRMMRA